MSVFITGLGVCLPNEPITNDQIESVLGVLGSHSSRVKDIILKRNGIQSRYYAIDPQTGCPTHSNTELTAEAIFTMAESCGFDLNTLEVLACGTSLADQFIPSHASMVHGLVGCSPCELASTSGVCCSGIAALKYGYMSVLSGVATNAVTTGSELVSTSMVAKNFHLPPQDKAGVNEEPYVAFDYEFLRWMLSDGAGALLLEGHPRPDSLSLRIDWIDLVSFANELETCMYGGAIKAEDGSLRSWRTNYEPIKVWQEGYFNLAQDVRLLKDTILPVAMQRSFEQVRTKHQLTPDSIDWLLPHLSSYFFEKPIDTILVDIGFAIPRHKWFTNLAWKGNTGAASMYIMLEELAASGRLQSGDRLLCVIPESARFTFAYMHLTVV